MSTHSPGPWVAIAGKSAGVQDCFYIHSEANRLAPRITTVFVQNGSFSQAQANARLIAAAPELKDSLFDLNAALDAFWNADPRNREPEIKALCEAQKRSFAAISKASDPKGGK